MDWVRWGFWFSWFFGFPITPRYLLINQTYIVAWTYSQRHNHIYSHIQSHLDKFILTQSETVTNIVTHPRIKAIMTLYFQSATHESKKIRKAKKKKEIEIEGRHYIRIWFFWKIHRLDTFFSFCFILFFSVELWVYFCVYLDFLVEIIN